MKVPILSPLLHKLHLPKTLPHSVVFVPRDCNSLGISDLLVAAGVCQIHQIFFDSMQAGGIQTLLPLLHQPSNSSTRDWDYLTKSGRLPIHSIWTASSNMVWIHLKTGLQTLLFHHIGFSGPFTTGTSRTPALTRVEQTKVLFNSISLCDGLFHELLMVAIDLKLD